MEIKVMTDCDRQFVMSIDNHVDDTSYANRVYTKSGYVIWEKDQRIGIIVHCILWDNLPFMNLIYIKEEHRKKGFGKQAVILWEQEMKKQGYKMALLSTQVNEESQHLYRKLGYVDCGGLVFHNTPFDQPMEMFFRKVL
ncbi:GNAT family N-acetyltransferase [Lachnospiraceae bacterium 62-26]